MLSFSGRLFTIVLTCAAFLPSSPIYYLCPFHHVPQWWDGSAGGTLWVEASSSPPPPLSPAAPGSVITLGSSTDTASSPQTIPSSPETIPLSPQTISSSPEVVLPPRGSLSVATLGSSTDTASSLAAAYVSLDSGSDSGPGSSVGTAFSPVRVWASVPGTPGEQPPRSPPPPWRPTPLQAPGVQQARPSPSPAAPSPGPGLSLLSLVFTTTPTAQPGAGAAVPLVVSGQSTFAPYPSVSGLPRYRFRPIAPRPGQPRWPDPREESSASSSSPTSPESQSGVARAAGTWYPPVQDPGAPAQQSRRRRKRPRRRGSPSASGPVRRGVPPSPLGSRTGSARGPFPQSQPPTSLQHQWHSYAQPPRQESQPPHPQTPPQPLPQAPAPTVTGVKRTAPGALNPMTGPGKRASVITWAPPSSHRAPEKLALTPPAWLPPFTRPGLPRGSEVSAGTGTSAAAGAPGPSFGLQAVPGSGSRTVPFWRPFDAPPGGRSPPGPTPGPSARLSVPGISGERPGIHSTAGFPGLLSSAPIDLSATSPLFTVPFPTGPAGRPLPPRAVATRPAPHLPVTPIPMRPAVGPVLATPVVRPRPLQPVPVPPFLLEIGHSLGLVPGTPQSPSGDGGRSGAPSPSPPASP